MKLEKTELFILMNNIKALNKFSQKPVGVYCTRHSTSLFRQILTNYKLGVKNKYFHITDTTRKRMANIPTEDIKGSKIIGLKEKSGETGYVCFNDKLHFIYAITNAGVLIMVSDKLSKNHVIQDGPDPYFSIKNSMLGFVYVDFISDHLQYWINNPLDILKNKNGTYLKEDRDSLNLLSKMLKEIEAYKVSNSITTIDDDTSANASPLYNNYHKDYNKRFDDTRLCLQTFMFVQFAKIIDTTRISVDDESVSFSERLKKRTKHSLDIIQVDTLYDENIEVINPFGVKGHFRNQPIGEGRKETKLIYIDSFMKTSYTRSATKIKEGI